MAVALSLALPLMAAACGPAVPVAEDLIPEYRGVETQLLDGSLVRFNVEMTNALEPANVAAYAECAAAGYTLVRGYGFARHISTQVRTDDAVWRGAAVYTISPDIPDGLAKLDAEVVAANCREKGIPLV